MISRTRWARRIRCWIPLAVALLPFSLSADDSMPYQVHFENSCRPEVQAEFDHAVTMLHSFEYLETTRIFDEIIVRDPACAMARWGAAMSIWHPLWAPPSQAELKAGAEILAAVDGLQSTPRESAYMDALKTFFSSSDTGTHVNRVRAYAERMGAVYMENLDDPEAAVFYALALLASADPRDKTYALQFKSAGLLNWVRASQPVHPGVLHYTIHSYDFPVLAHLALDAAKTYAAAAPDSAHAQHMPSHIFTRLGLWDLSLASNHDSTRSAAEYTVRARLPGHYDEGLHSIDYLMYAMLQTARDTEAANLLAQLAGIKKTDTENFKVAYTYAASPARYALERRAWEEAAELVLIRQDFAWKDFGWAQSIHFFARSLGAARSGQLEKAREDLAAIIAIEEALPATTLPYWTVQVRVQKDVAESWILFAEGEETFALELAMNAADREDAVDKHPVTPGEVLPARELYADMLLESGDNSGALAQYESVLRVSPNRLNAMIGAANAASGSGDAERAGHYRTVIRQQTLSGNKDRAGLRAMQLSKN